MQKMPTPQHINTALREDKKHIKNINLSLTKPEYLLY